MRISGGLGPDTTFSAQNTVVTANASKALRRLRRTVPIDEFDRKSLTLAAQLLDNIVQGSTFVEGKDISGLTRPTSTEDVWAYSHALSVIHELHRTEHATFLDTFREIRDTLAEIAAGGGGLALPDEQLAALENFFNTLNQVFFTDIYNGLLPMRAKEDDLGAGARA